jgi:hypothetical protein
VFLAASLPMSVTLSWTLVRDFQLSAAVPSRFTPCPMGIEQLILVHMDSAVSIHLG